MLPNKLKGGSIFRIIFEQLFVILSYFEKDNWNTTMTPNKESNTNILLLQWNYCLFVSDLWEQSVYIYIFSRFFCKFEDRYTTSICNEISADDLMKSSTFAFIIEEEKLSYNNTMSKKITTKKENVNLHDSTSVKM